VVEGRLLRVGAGLAPGSKLGEILQHLVVVMVLLVVHQLCGSS
jgi:hypothetical protein